MKTINQDFKQLIKTDFINNQAQGHLEAWTDRYREHKNKKDVSFDLKVNHDPSLEIERAEEELNRKLTDDESEKLVDLFNKSVIKLFKRHR